MDAVCSVNGAAAAQSIAVRFRPDSSAEPKVAGFLKHDLTARLVEGRLRVAGPDLPWFEWYMQKESAFFQILVTKEGPLGPPPAIVHGYAHFK